MTKIILSGANGHMGKVIAQIVENTDDMAIVAGVDLNTVAYAAFPIYTQFTDITEDADVIIDFSHPSVFPKLIEYATSTKTPVVLATTGLTKEQKATFTDISKKIPLFFSANMSLGINLLISLVKQAAKALEGQFDIEIIEKHHNQKIDAPSGTALAIADEISSALTKPQEFIYDRHASSKKRGQNEIGIHAVRGGTIVGEHDVIFAGRDEIIEINHKAHSKEVFAVGAVNAAKFLAKQNVGLYCMNDLFKM